MQKTTLRKRDLYLNRIIAFQDTGHDRYPTLWKIQFDEADGGAFAGYWSD